MCNTEGWHRPKQVSAGTAANWSWFLVSNCPYQEVMSGLRLWLDKPFGGAWSKCVIGPLSATKFPSCVVHTAHYRWQLYYILLRDTEANSIFYTEALPCPRLSTCQLVWLNLTNKHDFFLTLCIILAQYLLKKGFMTIFWHLSGKVNLL